MSTRSVIAASAPDGTWAGRYCHSDGYPTHMGTVLFALYRKHFNSDIDKMIRFLIDEHPAGWSFLGMPAEAGGVVVYDMPGGYVNDQEKLYAKDAKGKADYSKPLNHGPRCYCHGDRHEKGYLITSADSTSDLQWAYVISAGMRTMAVLKPISTGKKGADGYTAYKWTQVATVNLDGDEPNWGFVECGDKLERCGHYAWAHFPELRGTIMDHLGTAKFLGTTPMELHDAYAFEIGGVRYRASGSGSRVTSKRTGEAMWAMSLKPPTGHKAVTPIGGKAFNGSWGSIHTIGEDGSFYYPVYGYRKNGEEKQLPGVTPIYPPTLQQPLEVFAAIRAVRPSELPAEGSLETFITARKFRDEE